MVGSDHRPIVANILDKKQKRGKQFCFDKRWLGKEGLMESIAMGWELNSGATSRNFVDRISSCRREISIWRHHNDSQGYAKISELQRALEEVQKDDHGSPTDLKEITKKLQEAYKDEELFWQQKSRNLWFKEGDKNTKFFHAQTKQRRARNRIIGLMDNSGNWVNTDKKLAEVAVSYFQDLFTTTSPSDFEEILQEVPNLVSERMNESLTSRATEDEVRRALFLMDPGKAPGPDGMTALFYQRSWSLIKKDVLELVNQFLQNGSFDKRLNLTNICLIPKTSRPKNMAEFRPISLCNVGYKIISKVLCQRLKRVLPSVISETQSAFVSGRLITDNILIAQEMFHGLRTNKSCKSKFLAIKTDMSKAYDRLEWPFIENILRKLGFAEVWISWMMWCVRSVEYKVLINGCPYGRIIPSRGLRQGDPLSPYLFILCTEALIANVKRAEIEKSITGLKVSRASPPITHLLFADDSLFFCKATKEECLVVLQILKNYEKASGQQINFSKSSLQFGHKVGDFVRNEIKNILGISQLGGMGSYLGIPENLGGSKTQIFKFVSDRLQERVNSWTSKFLSKGGREILIKSVASALPTYVMSCFRLPKSLVGKLTSIIAKFWWSGNGTKQGMHWMAWKKLCVSKHNGGLGFKVIEDFNTALLAKQLWRLLEAKDSLLARVLRGRYYRDGNPLEHKKCYSPSYGWRSIISARSLIESGLIHRVGSGHSISVWKDPWIPAQHPRGATCKGINYYPSFKVNHLVDQSTQKWNMQLIKAIIDPSDAEIIQAIPVSGIFKQDKQGWHFTKSGKYTVKSGYATIQELYSRDISTQMLGPDVRPLQAFSWKLNCPRKIQHFIWQSLSGCVPVMYNIKSRGINCDSHCIRCGTEVETINHTLFECPQSRQTWALSKVPSAPDLFPTHSVFENLDYLFWRIPEANLDDSFPWIIWYIWKARNNKFHNNRDTDPRDTLQLAENEAMTWITAHEEEQNTTMSTASEVSTTVGSKCFIDGSWKDTDPYTGLGWMYQQDSIQEVLLGSRNIRRSLTPLHAELESLLWAMQSMITHQKKDVRFLTDCLELVKMVNSPMEWPAFETYLDELKTLKELLPNFSIAHILRRSNVQADNLARSARLLSHYECYVSSVPPVWITKPF